MFLINKKQNKACSFNRNGWHRVYFDNKRNGTKTYCKDHRLTGDQIHQRLLSFGYENCTEEEFNNYFIKNNEIKQTLAHLV